VSAPFRACSLNRPMAVDAVLQLLHVIPYCVIYVVLHLQCVFCLQRVRTYSSTAFKALFAWCIIVVKHCVSNIYLINIINYMRK